jgi:hypothetical protein
MRHIFLVMTAFIGGGLVAGVAPQSTMAAPFPQLAAGASAASAVETVGYWRRYCRYNDCSGTPDVDVDVVVPAVPAPVVVPSPVVVPENPPVIAIVPVRPVSCGEFRYWNGIACVDARYNNPYTGPR